MGGGPLPVDDGKACTVDTCNEEKDTIVNADVPVDDNDPCTQDSCDPSGKVVHTPILDCCREDAQCEKIVPASDVTVCRKAGGTCQPTNKCLKNIETVIDDGIACTKDLCDPATGTVTHPPSAKVGECCASDADCPGGDRGGKCFAPGTCGKATFTCAYNEGKPIDDGILCTTDSCNAATGAVINAVPAGTKCCSEDSECPKQEDTGAFCKPGSMCDQGVCVPRGTGMPRPGGDLECLAYRCAPDGSWATCCVASNPDCVCLEPTPGSVCDNGGIKQ